MYVLLLLELELSMRAFIRKGPGSNRTITPSSIHVLVFCNRALHIEMGVYHRDAGLLA
jgi:hypothetical protein